MAADVGTRVLRWVSILDVSATLPATSLSGVSLLLGVLTIAGPVLGQCPPVESLVAEVRGLELTGTYREQELARPTPWTLYREAASRPGKVALERDGNLGLAVLVTDLPVEQVWMAINDEDHYAADGFIPVEHSRVIGGTPRGQQRQLFQWFRRAGVGRWWIDQVVMNEELFERSRGRLWELRWWDLMDTHADSGPPEEYADLGLGPIAESRGAWLLISLSERCTLIEYATVSKPGGVLSLAHRLGSGIVIRQTLEGADRLAREHIPEPHSEALFVRPDGLPISRHSQ